MLRVIGPQNLSSVLLQLQSTVMVCQFQTAPPAVDRLASLAHRLPLSICFINPQFVVPEGWELNVETLGPTVIDAVLSIVHFDTLLILVADDPTAFPLYDIADLVYAAGALEMLLRQRCLSFRVFASVVDVALDVERLFRQRLLRHRPTALAARKRRYLQE